MIGAIAGDIIGSVYEASPIKTTEFPLFHAKSRFTDDTVLTVAIANAIVEGSGYRDALRDFGRRYPDAGYGGSFIGWLFADDPRPYNSYGNGAAMRVSPVGFAFEPLEVVLDQAKLTADVSHDHPEGIKGAQATAAAVFLARTTHDKDLIKQEVTARFGYDLDRTLEQIRPTYGFDVSCQGSVPQAIVAFLESDSWESAVRNAVSLGGDSDTQACIAGGIAEAFYGQLEDSVIAEVETRLSADLQAVVARFADFTAHHGTRA
ncbi:MAG: ADP-ribosylglycohydrolase family protein [Gammaproteobacteria bacterium]|nr:ADP-ribosylglycohydrolase family protein [Gammaproteobacteria bacterium]